MHPMGWENTMRGASLGPSREVRIRVPFFSVVHFSRGTLPQKRVKGTTGGPSVVFEVFLDDRSLGISVWTLQRAANSA